MKLKDFPRNEPALEALRPAGLPTHKNIPWSTAGLYTIWPLLPAGYAGYCAGTRNVWRAHSCARAADALLHRRQRIVSRLGAHLQSRSRYFDFDVTIGTAG